MLANGTCKILQDTVGFYNNCQPWNSKSIDNDKENCINNLTFVNALPSEQQWPVIIEK